MHLHIGLDNVELVDAADRAIEFTDEMGDPGIRAVHALQLEANVEAARRIERSLDGDGHLIQQRGISTVIE